MPALNVAVSVLCVGLPAYRQHVTLSIIIVNYNVKYFLEQCLYSVQRAVAALSAEVLVIDNASTDGSVAYLQPKFPQVRFLESDTNLGFAKACNWGVERSVGDAVLFLNPDTLLAEDTLHTCMGFLKSHPEAGALGVRMIDGTGRFLKESKRSFPSPLTSAFKLLGLARLFPHSPFFSRYHLGHLDALQSHDVDVLAGAFMLVRRSVLQQTGAFDDTFFMYGEDVDLSYRIQKAGYKNYYLAETGIIHFKGESTKRGSLNYVRMFYSAMSRFVQKHYGGSRAAVFTGSIQLAIRLRAALTVFAKFIAWVGLPVLDALLFLGSFWLVKGFWATYIRPENRYPQPLLLVAFPVFTLVYLIVAYYAGWYDKERKLSYLVRAGVIATLALLAVYALLPEHLRFSRGMLLFGALLAAIGMLLLRVLLQKLTGAPQPLYRGSKPYLLIAGSATEYEDLKKLLPASSRSKIIGRVAIDADERDAVATLEELPIVAAALNAQELIFCSGAVSYKTLIDLIQTLPRGLRLRFHAPGSKSIVGSDSSTAAGEAVSTQPVFNIDTAVARRLKRLIDLVTAFLLLLFFPLHLLLHPHAGRLLRHAIQVLIAKKTWIGYALPEPDLPTLRPAVINSEGIPVHGHLKKACPELVEGLPHHHPAIDFWYARNWEPLQDIKLILKNYRRLGG